jgi:enamine deaminase RidA (YjgF/YER057c/UK114 family)
MSLDIIERALREVDAALLDVVRVRVFVPDRADIEAVSGVLKKRLGAARAANTTVCSPLAVDEAKVEIEVTALRGQDRRASSAAGRAASRAPSRSRARRRPR